MLRCGRAVLRARARVSAPLPCVLAGAWASTGTFGAARCGAGWRAVCSSWGVPDFAVQPKRLEGQCSCGKSGFKAHGPSFSSFVSHAAELRAAAKSATVATATFPPSRVAWVGTVRKEHGDGTNDALVFCSACKDFLGMEAVEAEGYVGVALARAAEVDDAFRPNFHLMYSQRVEDVEDGLPKWTARQGGDLHPAPRTPAAAVAAHTAHHATTGQFRKDVLPLSPTRAPCPGRYAHPDIDPSPASREVSAEAVRARRARKYAPSSGVYVAPSSSKYDAIVVGGGHNGLVSAAYLAKHGMKVCVLERRHVVGGAAVTEELFPGFRYSRASYLAGLLRPQIIDELGLERHGFKYLPRDPSSFTPTTLSGHHAGKYLILGSDEAKNWESIAQFSARDADAFVEYEAFLAQARDLVEPLLDCPPPALDKSGTWRHHRRTAQQLEKLGRAVLRHRNAVVPFYELFMGPAAPILDRWFESDILKTTLATDAVIGAMTSPSQAGSAYVLLHHVMGEAAGRKGVWAYVEGGMGKLSACIADSAREFGAEIVTNATVSRLVCEGQRVVGVEMEDKSQLRADIVLSNATPYHTFLELLPGHAPTPRMPEGFRRHIQHTDYACGAFKINCAVDRLPNFECFPSPPNSAPGPMHRGTIHFESELEEIEQAYREASAGVPASRPVIEMTIPSALDTTLAPPGHHVVQLFVQFAPYHVDPSVGHWADPVFKTQFADRVCRIIDEFAPGFSSSLLHRDILSPLDLERIFGLQQGNIFHGSISLHQLGYTRPAPGFSNHRTPLQGLYLCGSGAHPGGGVMGAPGRNAAFVVLGDKGLA